MSVIDRAILQDEIRQALNALFANGQVGRSKQNVLTFNGDTTGKVVSNSMVKISDTIMDLTTALKTVMSYAPEVWEEVGMEYQEITAEKTTIIDANGIQGISYMDTPFVMSVTTPNAQLPEVGLWVLCVDGQGWVSRVEFPETIHPIAPKYLPEGVVGHTDVKQTVIVPKQTAEFIENEGMYVLPLGGLLLTPGAEYLVMWDGKERRCICATESDMPYIGNLAITGGPNDTGEPFCATGMDGNSGIITSESGTHSFSIVQIEKTIHVIASQYIMPEIDLSDYISTTSTGSVKVTDETVVSALNQAIEKNAFILARIGYGVGGFTYYILTKVWNSNKIGFEVSNGALAVSVYKDVNGSEWTCHTANI